MPQSMVIGAAITTRTRIPRLGAHLQELSHYFSRALDVSSVLKGAPFASFNLILRICNSGENAVSDLIVQGSELHATYHVSVEEIVESESPREYLGAVIEHNTLEALKQFRIDTRSFEQTLQELKSDSAH